MSKSIYPQKPIIVVVGPTASGKSDLAVKLALRLSSGQAQKKFGIKGAEIVSADSRQVYRGMDIGTGKVPISYERSESTKSSIPSKDGIQMFYKNIRHHLLDVASPSRRFTAAQYKKLGQVAIKKIRAKNKLPIICGGTGFYIRALVDDLPLPAVKPNLKLRAKLEKKPTEELYNLLKKLDPRRAASIDRHNPRRLVRALEIVMTTGQPVPTFNSSQPPLNLRGGTPSLNLREGRGELQPLFLGIKKSQPELARRIKIRLQKRLKQGMLAEVKNLRAQGVSWKRLDSFGLEYRWLAKYLQNKISYPEMVARLQKDIEHYAKRQMTWFNKDKRIHWIKNYPDASKIVSNFQNK